MKTAVTFLVLTMGLLACASLYLVYENNGLRDKLDLCCRQIAGYEHETEILSNLLVKERLGGEWPHMVKK